MISCITEPEDEVKTPIRFGYLCKFTLCFNWPGQEEHLTSRYNEALACDVIPNPPQTEFLQETNSVGAKTLDGLGMLVYQGALALTMWTGKEAPIIEMKEALSGFFARNG